MMLVSMAGPYPHFKKPSEEAVSRFRKAQKDRTFPYPGIGGTRNGSTPPGYQTLQARIRLGSGPGVFEKAKAAVRSWKMYDFPWVELCWPDTPIETGRDVVVLSKVCGLWFQLACRIVYVIDSDASRYGFAYGTLPDHLESGEELFLVERHPDGSVWYEIRSFSRPSFFLFRMANTFIVRVQKLFLHDSLQAMQKAVSETAGP